MQDPQKKQLSLMLGELSAAVEDLLLAGLTAASKSTIERLDVTFKEASRMQLLRLGSTLRIANEEISRFTAGSPQFSSRRLAFFLGRAWTLATGMRRAIEQNDDEVLQRLMATPLTQALPSIRAVVMGVGKRVVSGAFASFEFRLRSVEAAGELDKGEPLIWSCVFPMRGDLDLPAEAFLHLPMKQKFKPAALLQKRIVRFSNCATSRQVNSPARLTLADESKVTVEDDFADWRSLCGFDVGAAAERLRQHRPTPLDLEIELQEELCLEEWTPGSRDSLEDGYDLLSLIGDKIAVEARLDRGPSGQPLCETMQKLAASSKRPPLYGVIHYEMCRIIFQPMTALQEDGPQYLTVSPNQISQAELVRAMKFT